MYSQYPKMRPLGLVIWRLRHSRLRREFHLRVAETVSTIPVRGWVLDVGSGPGLLAGRLLKTHPGLRIACLDVEPGMLEAARAAGCPHLVRATADRLPFRTSEFDLVLSTASLKDWANRAAGLSEISRVLHPGGTALVYDFITVGPGSNPKNFIRRFGIVAELLRRRMGRMIPFSLQDLQKLADGSQSGEIQTRVEPVEEFGAGRIVLKKRAET